MWFCLIISLVATAIAGTDANPVTQWIQLNICFDAKRVAVLSIGDALCGCLFAAAVYYRLIVNRMANRKSDKKLDEETKIRA